MGNFHPDRYQKKVIESHATHIVVKAGAGSGKTSTMIEKIRLLVDCYGADQKSIVVLTFTNVAASYMRTKYLNESNKSYSDDSIPYFGTFHAFCYRVLSENQDAVKAIGYEHLPYIADDIEMQNMIMESLNAVGSSLTAKQISNKENLYGKKRLEYEHYIKYLKSKMIKNNIIDFDTLSESVCNLFKTCDASVSKLKDECKYLFVDEFQDTDNIQFDFIKSMEKSRVFLFGDPMQNIYRFRGCTNTPMKNLVKDDKWVKFELPIDYRSTVNICSYVNNFSAEFKSKKYGVDLITDKKGDNVREAYYHNYQDLYDMVFRYVSIKKRCGSIACLARTNREVDCISSSLKRFGIDCSSSTKDDYSYNVIMSVKYRDYRTNWLSSKLSKNDYMDYCRLCRCLDENPIEINPKQFKSIASEVQDIDELDAIFNQPSIYSASDYLKDRYDIDIDINDKNIDSMNGIIEEALYLSSCDQPKSEVFVGTIHAAKGLEFDSVAVIGVDGKSFKISNEENENLYYTACTRAKDNLIVFKYRCCN